MPKARSRRFQMFCALGLLVLAPAALAQNSGIQGVISDASGGVIPAANVTVANVATGVEFDAQSNETGFYSVPFLSPGTYNVTAQTEGFAPSVRENLKLDVQQTARVDFALSVGTVTEVVEVSAAAALLDSEQATMGQVIENKRIVEMREAILNKRNYLELAQLSVGILPGATIGAGTRPGREEAGFVGMGMRGYQNNVMIDGIDNGSRAGGGPLGFEAQASKPSVDAVSEFKVVTNNMSAEYGFRMGPKVLVSIKSGSNDLHGSAYEFIRNDKLDATNFFANRSGSIKPTLRQNQFGVTFGGPIIKNKTFGFFSYEGTRIRLGRSLLSTVPAQLTRNGDFSMERRNFNQIFDPETTVGTGAAAIRDPFPNNVIPSSRFDPVSRPLVDLYPLPNIQGREFGANNYFRAPSDADDTNQYDFRVDHNFSDNDRVFFRMSVRRQFRINQSRLPTEAGGSQGGQTVDLNGDNLAFNWTHSFSARMHNEFRFGFTHFPTRFDTLLQEPLNAFYGIKGAPGDTFDDGFDQGFSHFNINGYNALGTQCCWPNINNMDNIQIVDNLLWQKGSHSIKIGFDYRRLNIFREAMRFRRGQFLFNRVFTAEQPNNGGSRSRTGNGLAEMMLGTVGRTRVGNPAGENAIIPYYGFYVQDDWKVTQKLTLTLGLRWELFGRGYYPTGDIPGRSGVSNYITAFNGLQPGEEEFRRRPADGSDCGCVQDKNNFAPRIGFAYRLNDKTVVRASGGLFYGEADRPIS